MRQQKEQQDTRLSPHVMLQTDQMIHDMLPSCDVNMLTQEQDKASPHEMTIWKERGG